MARFFGEIGYGLPVEDPPDSGIWVDDITEYEYYGDILRNTRQNESGDQINGNFVIQNSISVIANEHAFKHFHEIKYVRWSGGYWIVNSVEVRPPRLILSLGGVYNGPKA